MTTPAHYHDFRLAFEADDDGGFWSRLLWSPAAGYPKERLKLPPAVSRDRPNVRQDAEKIGAALFNAVFTGEIGEKYRSSLDLLKAYAGHGLRIRVTIDPRSPGAEKLLAVSWEDLFDPEDGRFLSRGRNTTLVRDPVEPLVLLTLVEDPPPRILVVASRARPPGYSELRVDEELAGIRAAWDGAGIVETVDPAELDELDRRLDEGRFHVVHVIGHGILDEGEGVIWLDRRDGEPRPVSASELTERLRDRPSLRLVVLNTCLSAAIPTAPAPEPMRSVALALMHAGLPAVIAQRTKIADDAAVSFGTELHRRLAAGVPVDAAVAKARMAIDDGDPTFEWWQPPVLYLAAPDGQIFDHGEVGREPAPRTAAGPRPLRLAVRSFDHPFDELRSGCDHLLDLLPSFAGRAIRKRDDWQRIVLPAVREFLQRYVTVRRPLELRLDAHLSIAFAAGWSLNTRGVEMTIRQATMDGFRDWKLESGGAASPGWRIEDVKDRKVQGRDVVVAVSIARDARLGAERYIAKRLHARVRRLVSATVEPAPGNDAVRDGAHAFALARELVRHLDRVRQEEGSDTVHLFLAVPGSFAFCLGQLAGNLGTIQLYEWPHGKSRKPLYKPSLRLKAEKGGRQ